MAKLMQTTAAPKQEQWQQGDIVQDEKGNRLQLSGDRWLPIEAPLTEEQTALSQIGPVEAFGRAAYERASQLTSGARMLLGTEGHPLYDGGAADLAASKARMRGIEEGNPNAAWAGGLAPDVVGGLGVAALTGGAGIPAMLAAEGAYGAGVGALSNPAAPLEGAALGGGLGVLGGAGGAVAGAALRRTGITDRVMGMFKQIDGSTTRRAAEPGNTLDPQGLATMIETADRVGIKVPLSVRTQSQFIENVGLQLESSPFTSWLSSAAGESVGAANAKQLGKLASEALGIVDGPLTPHAIRAAERAAAKTFEAVSDFAPGVGTKAELRQTVAEAIEESFVGKNKFLKKVDNLLGDFKDDVLDADKLMKLQSSLGDLARKAKGETRMQISRAREAIIDRVTGNAASMSETYRTARERWATARALENAIGARGMVQPVRLAKNLGASRGQNTPIGRLADAAEVMSFVRPSKYGTENAARGGLLGTLGVGLGIPAAGVWAYNQTK